MKKQKTWQDNVKDAIWQLTSSASNLKGLNGYEDIMDDIIILRNKLQKKFNS